MFLPDAIQRELRVLQKINENEVVKKEGDIYIAIDVNTSNTRILQENKLIESLASFSSGKKKLLKG